mgnify:CR=1 FL=1
MKNNKYTNYKNVIKVLKKNCSLAFDISVRRSAMSQCLDGECVKYKKKFYIRINRDLPEDVAIDTLLHEWAHARAWNHLLDNLDSPEKFDDFSHDASWGVAYSEVYRVYQKHFLSGSSENKNSEETLNMCSKRKSYGMI